jgi:hypothetical protein
LDLRALKQRKDGKDYIMRSFPNCSFTNYYYVDHVKEYWMRGACNTHERDEKLIKNVGRET